MISSSDSSDGCDLVDYCGGGGNAEKDYDDEDDPVQVIVTKFLYKIHIASSVMIAVNCAYDLIW